MTMTTTTYRDATNAIRTHAEARQAALDSEALAARAANLAAYRAACQVPDDDPAAPIAALIAQTIQIGNDAGYPAVWLPADTRNAIKAGLAAGLITHTIGGLPPIRLYHDEPCFSGNALPEWQIDHDAWTAAKTYRDQQLWEKL